MLTTEQYRVVTFDIACDTHFGDQWREIQEAFEELLDATDMAAIRIVGKLRAFYNLRSAVQDQNSAYALDFVAKELRFIQETLPILAFDSHEFHYIDTTLNRLQKELETSDSIALLSTKTQDAEETVMDIEKQLCAFLKAQTSIELERTSPFDALVSIFWLVASLLGAIIAVGDRRAQLLRLNCQKQDLMQDLDRSKTRLHAAREMLSNVDADRLLQLIQDMQAGVSRLKELVPEVWSSVLRPFTVDIARFLEVLGIHLNTPESASQPLDDLRHQMMLSIEMSWEMARILENDYIHADK